MTCRLFDIKQMGIHDGPGLRLTLFFKGCPLNCVWCHNPEGIKPNKQLIKNENLCSHCGLCRQPCRHVQCQEFNSCTLICPQNLVSICGTDYDTDDLAKEILSYKPFYKTKGGVTFSGGEPLLQYEAVLDIINKIDSVNTCIETCGLAPTDVFLNVTGLIDNVYVDIKLIDEAEHIKYTGCSNKLILHNILSLAKTNKPFVVRVPLIPDITDTNHNLNGIADFLAPYNLTVSVELLPYNKMTGAKYRIIGKTYSPPFDQQKEPKADLEPFRKRNIKVRVLK